MGLWDFFKRGSGPASARRAPTDEDLFDDEFQRKLETLAIVSKRVFSGKNRAERKTKKSGSGIEFVDHRDYVEGDDLRYLDWNLYQRFGKLQVRLFEEEEDLSVYRDVDVHVGMGFGDRDKLYAIVVLAGTCSPELDRVAGRCYSAAVVVDAAHARQAAHPARLPVSSRPQGRGHDRPSRRHQGVRGAEQAARHRGAGERFLRSRGLQLGINVLRYNKFEPLVVHITDQREAKPKLLGDIRVYDCETGEEREVTVTPKILERYQQEYGKYAEDVERFCKSKQVPYFVADVSQPFEELVLRVFRRGGFLRLGATSHDPRSASRSRRSTIAAIAGGLTVVLYILKMRRRAVAVPFAKIWQRILRDQDATSLFSQLKRFCSLLVQLALLALLLFALGDPRLSQNVLEGRNVVVVIDASASMKSVDVAPSRSNT